MTARQARMRFCGAVFLALVLGAAFYFLVYLPQDAELRAKEAEARSLRGEIARAAAFRHAHPDPAQEAKTLGARKTRADGLLPARLDLNAFLAEAQRQAADAGVVLLAIEPGEAEAADGLVRAPIRLSVRGDYFAWLDFLYALEQRSRFVNIDAVRGTADEGGAFSGTIELWIYARGQ